MITGLWIDKCRFQNSLFYFSNNQISVPVPMCPGKLVLPGILGSSVQCASRNPYPISDQTRNFQKFSSGHGNEPLQSPWLFPSLDSTYKHPWWKSWLRKDGKVPNETSRACRGLYPLRNVADLVYSNRFKQNHKNIHENVTFTLASDENPLEKIANPKYNPIDIEMN